MPRASDFCAFVLGENEVPTKTNPLGVKGAGESGTVGALSSIMNAVNDALARIGARLCADAGNAGEGVARRAGGGEVGGMSRACLAWGQLSPRRSVRSKTSRHAGCTRAISAFAANRMCRRRVRSGLDRPPPAWRRGVRAG